MLELVVAERGAGVDLEARHFARRLHPEVDACERQLERRRERDAAALELVRELDRLEVGVQLVAKRVAVVGRIARDRRGVDLVTDDMRPDVGSGDVRLKLDGAPADPLQLAKSRGPSSRTIERMPLIDLKTTRP